MKTKFTEPQWRRIVDDKENDLVIAIKMHLRTEPQRQWLHDHDLSLEDILNGRYPLKLASEVRIEFFKPWNDQLGWKEFIEL